MKCERCGQNEATYFVRSNVNGRVTQSHLCPACARAMGVAGRTSLWDDGFFTRPFSLLEPFFGTMGQGLLGAKKNQTVSILIPNGTIRYKIMSIRKN